MIQLTKPTKGFSLIGVFLLVIVLAALAFGGWKVYDNRKDENTAPNTSTPLTNDSVPATSPFTNPAEINSTIKDLDQTDIDSELDTSDLEADLDAVL